MDLLNLPPSLSRCLTATKLIDSTHSGVRLRTRRVSNWKSGSMALRWAAAAFLETKKKYRRTLGYRDLWILKAHLDDRPRHKVISEERRAGSRSGSETTGPINVEPSPAFNYERDSVDSKRSKRIQRIV